MSNQGETAMQKTIRSGPCRPKSALTRLPLTAAIYLAMGSAAFAQATPAPEASTSADQSAPAAKPGKTAALGTVTVTAQKRVENLQKVPISINVLGEERLEQQSVSEFQDFAILLPSVSFNEAGGGVFPGPGFLQVYMRGVASGGDGNHSGSQPSVGMYLDEQPITTIQGSLDVHVYDVARIEALAGPQGTLYGASSQAGTIRIITNKPDPSALSSGFSIEANAIDGGGIGNVVEGFTNIPLSDHAAIRLVGWSKHRAGYVDNVLGSRTYPTSGITATNADRVETDYNDSNTIGARAALKVDLNDDWSITPTIMGQHQQSYGSSGYDPSVGDLEVVHFYPESSDDKWRQASLTVQGKIGNFDLTYAFSHLKRDVDSNSDYSDYGFWYDTLAGYGAYFYDDNGDLINPAQYIHAIDGYKKSSHELRISSPADDRLRFVAGVFYQDQSHAIFQDYKVTGLASSISVPGFEDTIWLTAQQRKDHDEAVFGELTYDITDQWSVTGGMRFFRAKNSLRGFFGYGAGYSGSTGEAACFSPEQVMDAPCTNLDKKVSENGSLGKVNVTYNIDDRKMVYFTWSEGYRPGGINRRGTLPPYKSDFLTNWEFGWKSKWADDRLVFNGALFQENWKDFQFSYLGQNGLTEIRNAGQARIRGMEVDLNWAATYALNISGGLALYDAKLTQDYCSVTDTNGLPVPDCYLASRPYDRALAGSRLPLTARVKGNLTARYTFDLGRYEAHWQASVIHQGSRTTDLREAQRELITDLDPYTMLDLSAGLKEENWSLEFFVKNAFNSRAEYGKFSQCATLTCGFQPYTITAQPRTFGVRFSRDF
jgi:outer membrane receptor protein involved in Fe transport